MNGIIATIKEIMVENLIWLTLIAIGAIGLAIDELVGSSTYICYVDICLFGCGLIGLVAGAD